MPQGAALVWTTNDANANRQSAPHPRHPLRDAGRSSHGRWSAPPLSDSDRKLTTTVYAIALAEACTTY